MNRHAALLLFCVLTSSARGQHCVYNAGSDPGTGVLLSDYPLAPFAVATEQRTQVLVTRHLFLGAPVRIVDIALAPMSFSTITASSITVRMAHRVSDRLEMTFDNNMSQGAATVLDARSYTFGVVGGRWSSLGLQTPFTYVPAQGNLVVEIVVRGLAQTKPVQFRTVDRNNDLELIRRDYPVTNPIAIGVVDNLVRLQLCIETADLSILGRGCNGSGGTPPGLGFSGSSRLGNTTQIVLSNTLPSAPAALMLGTDSRPPYPLSPGGTMPGCLVYQNPEVFVPLFAGPGGTAVIPLAIPSDENLVTAVLYAQFVVFDARANAAGIVLTNQGRILIGR